MDNTVDKILAGLVNAINEYDNKYPVTRVDIEDAPEELKAYWKAKDIAEEYLNKK